MIAGVRRVRRWARARLGNERRRDRGSAAIVMVVFGFTFVGLAAFVVDGGLSLANKQRAEDIAEQAARYAAQDIDVDALRRGEGARINKDNCTERVRRFTDEFDLARAEVARPVCLTGADPANAITVRVPVTYEPVFSSFLTGPITVYGQSRAEAQTG